MSKAWRYLLLKIAIDIGIVNFAFISAFVIKFKMSFFAPALIVYFKPLLFLTTLWLVVLNLAGLYKLQNDKFYQHDNVLAVSFGVFSAAFFSYSFITFFHQEASYSKDIVVIGSLIALVLINASRYLIWKMYLVGVK